MARPQTAREVEIKLAAPEAQPQTLRLDRRQEGHKWIQVGGGEPRSAGQAAVIFRNIGDGMTAINSVAWVKQPAR